MWSIFMHLRGHAFKQLWLILKCYLDGLLRTLQVLCFFGKYYTSPKYNGIELLLHVAVETLF